MKIVFVRYTVVRDDQSSTCIQLLSGDEAESQEAALSYLNDGDPIVITDWFEVPKEWKNAVASDPISDAFEALIGLDALGQTPVVSDLLATIFEAGYRLGAKLPQKT
jgi:hypothetical protein